jgi:hypothetical protein
MVQSRNQGAEWPQYIGKIISFEMAASQLKKKDLRYARLETWPEEK